MPWARADWLHLLATPEAGWRRLVVIGADPTTRRQVERCGLSAAVSFETADLAAADAVAILDGSVSDAVLRAAPNAGAVLIRFGRRGLVERFGARIASDLRRQGFAFQRPHWPVPSTECPRRYLPLDHSGALRWYADHLLVERDRETQVRTATAIAAARLRPRLLAGAVPALARHRLPPSCRTGRVRGPHHDQRQRSVEQDRAVLLRRRRQAPVVRGQGADRAGRQRRRGGRAADRHRGPTPDSPHHCERRFPSPSGPPPPASS